MNANGASRFRREACLFEWRHHPPRRAPRAPDSAVAAWLPFGAASRRVRPSSSPRVHGGISASSVGASVASGVLASRRLRCALVCSSHACSLTRAPRAAEGLAHRLLSAALPTLLRGSASPRGLPCLRGSVPHTRHRMRQDYPLNLSISLSGGEETNQDAPSNGE